MAFSVTLWPKKLSIITHPQETSHVPGSNQINREPNPSYLRNKLSSQTFKNSSPSTDLILWVCAESWATWVRGYLCFLFFLFLGALPLSRKLEREDLPYIAQTTVRKVNQMSIKSSVYSVESSFLWQGRVTPSLSAISLGLFLTFFFFK